MESNILEFLEENLGTPERKSKNNFQYYCPFCNHKKKKLSVKIPEGYWHCWVCDTSGKSFHSLFSRLGIKKEKYSGLNISSISQENVENLSIRNLPPEFKSLYNSENSLYKKMAMDFLRKRNVSGLEILRNNIGYCDSGHYSGMLIFPNYDSRNHLNYFTTRSFINKASGNKFINPPIDKSEIIGRENLINWDYPVILCESFLDALSIGENSIPLFGKVLSKKLKSKILEKRVRKVYVFLDGDAIKSSIRVLEYLQDHGIKVYLVETPEDEDPSSLGREKCLKLLNSAKTLDDNLIFEKKIEFMINGF